MKVLENVLQCFKGLKNASKKDPKGWIGLCKILQVLEVPQRSIRFCEVLRSSKKIPLSRTVFLKVSKKTVEVLHGFTGFRDSIRFHQVRQRKIP